MISQPELAPGQELTAAEAKEFFLQQIEDHGLQTIATAMELTRSDLRWLVYEMADSKTIPPTVAEWLGLTERIAYISEAAPTNTPSDNIKIEWHDNQHMRQATVSLYDPIRDYAHNITIGSFNQITQWSAPVISWPSIGPANAEQAAGFARAISLAAEIAAKMSAGQPWHE